MAAVPAKNAKAIIQDEKDVKESVETPTSVITTNSLNAPKHGTVIPNRVFVGGICSATTEAELVSLFSNYGTVIGAKIIADRAGVSKGYGFVTFETEEEAKRLQKDGYGRAPSYDCSPATPVAMPSQVFRQNGIAYTFHNGMAFFPQPPPQPMTPQHMEPPVYQQGTPFGAMPQGSPAPAYQYPFSQGQVIYQPPPQYQYHIPQYDGCYDPQVMMHDGNMMIPQYYLAPQPGHEMAYYAPTPLHPQEPSPSLQHPIMYPSPRTFDTAILYSSELSTQSEASVVQVQEADASATNPVTTTTGYTPSNNEITSTSTPVNENNKKGRGETPVVSLLKVQGQNNSKENTNSNNHNNNNNHKVTSTQNYQQARSRKPRQFEDFRRPGGHLNNNNNSPDAANRNLVPYCPQQQQQQQQRGSRRGSGASGEEPSYPRPPSVPTFPFYRHPGPNIPPFYPQPPPHRTRTVFYRPPRYTGGMSRGGRGHHGYQPSRSEGSKWKEEESQPLTPPITPKSEAGRAATPAQPEELVKSMQTVSI